MAFRRRSFRGRRGGFSRGRRSFRRLRARRLGFRM